MDGPWSQFAPATATSAPAADGPWSQFAAPAASGQGEFGYAPAPDDTPPVARLGNGGASVVPLRGQLGATAVPQASAASGLAANALAGLQEGAAGLVNIASDPVQHLVINPLTQLGMGGYNLGARMFGYNKLSPELMHDMLSADGIGTPGEEVVNRLSRAVDAPTPADVTAATPGQRYLRAGVGGAFQMLPMLATGGLGAVARVAGEGASSGVGSQVGSDIAPDDLKGAASLIGGTVVPMAPKVMGAGVSAVTRPITNAVANAVGPIMGRVNPLIDEAGSQP